jgi:uroporphyrinogen decarboxylase
MSLAAKLAKHVRIAAALAGERPDRLPLGLWVHFPDRDGEPAALAHATIDFYRRYDLDFIKITPRMAGAIEDWGAELGSYHPTRGFYLIAQRPIHEPDDWYGLTRVAPDRGAQAAQLETLRLVKAELGNEAPIVMTLFAPSMAASFVADDTTFTRHLREAPAALAAGLHTIAQTTADFGLAALEAGADGIFFSIKHASGRVLEHASYDALDRTFDRPVAQTLHERSTLTIVHIHGGELDFDRFAAYPMHALSWYDRVDGPQLDRARAALPGIAFAGGIDHERTLMLGTPEEIKAEVADAAAQTGGRRLVVAPGCTLPIVVPHESLRAVREAVNAVVPS